MSKYITAIPLDGGKHTILYNPVNQSIIVSDKKRYRKIDNLARDIKENKIMSSELTTLKKESFVVENPDDETKLVEKYLCDFQNDTSTLNITLLPTYACNMSCEYCFENKVKNSYTMSSNACVRSLKWIFNKLEETKPKSLNILLFGGEPLLSKKLILFFSEELFKKTFEMGIKLSIDLVTNGTLLDFQTVSKLKDFGLNDIKVTLDGIDDYHDKKRMLKNGRGTFKKIINNLLKIHTLCNITIGINFDSENEAGVMPLIHFLSKSPLRKSITSISVKPIMYDGLSENHRKYLSCSQTVEEFNASLKYVQYVKKCGFQAFDRVHLGPCEANRSSSFTIDPYGDIYLCPAAIGRAELKVGSVFKDKLGENYKKFVETNPLKFSKCRRCQYLPMCFGGCRLLSYFKTGDFAGINCEKDYFRKISPALLKLEIEDEINP